MLQLQGKYNFVTWVSGCGACPAPLPLTTMASRTQHIAIPFVLLEQDSQKSHSDYKFIDYGSALRLSTDSVSSLKSEVPFVAQKSDSAIEEIQYFLVRSFVH